MASIPKTQVKEVLFTVSIYSSFKRDSETQGKEAPG